MVVVLRRFRISTRLIAAIGVLLALLAGTVLVGVSAIVDLRKATRAVADDQHITRLAMQVKFRGTR
jgi:hypothetical protein